MDTRQLTHEVRMRHWAEVLRRRRESGQTVRGFCRAEDICEKTYYYWQRQLRQAAGEALAGQGENQTPHALPTAPVFAALPAPKVRSRATGVVRIEVGGAVVEIGPEVDTALVMTILRTLSGQC
jgi:transposase-like protein